MFAKDNAFDNKVKTIIFSVRKDVIGEGYAYQWSLYHSWFKVKATVNIESRQMDRHADRTKQQDWVCQIRGNENFVIALFLHALQPSYQMRLKASAHSFKQFTSWLLKSTFSLSLYAHI